MLHMIALTESTHIAIYTIHVLHLSDALDFGKYWIYLVFIYKSTKRKKITHTERMLYVCACSEHCLDPFIGSSPIFLCYCDECCSNFSPSFYCFSCNLTIFNSGSRPADLVCSLCAYSYGVAKFRIFSAASEAGAMCSQVIKWHSMSVIKECCYFLFCFIASGWLEILLASLS